MTPPPPRSTLFPYTTLFRSRSRWRRVFPRRHRPAQRLSADRDRKSTRLNSSHVAISYAVFCLKKNKNEDYPENVAGSRQGLVNAVLRHDADPPPTIRQERHV